MQIKKRNLCVGVVILALFAVLAAGVMNRSAWVQAIDNVTAKVAAGFVRPINTAIFKVIGFLGSPATVIGLTLILCVFLWFKRGGVISLWVAGLQLGGSALAEIIKKVVARPRPTHQLIPDTGFSFPSGHTFCTLILVMTILMLVLPYIEDQEVQLVVVIAGVFWIGLVAASRVYFRDHFGTDVLASVLFGSGYWLVITSFEQPIKNLIRHILPKRFLAERTN